MATIPKQPIEVAFTTDGGPPLTKSYPEAASQSFSKGAFVTMTAGKIVESTSSVDGATAALGIAAHAASGVTDTPVMVYMGTPNTVFVANLTGTQVTAITDVGTGLGAAKTSTNWHVNKGGTAGTLCEVVALDPRDTVGDTAGRVHFVIAAANRLVAF